MKDNFNKHLNELAQTIKIAKKIVPQNETEKMLLSQQIEIDTMKFENGLKAFTL